MGEYKSREYAWWKELRKIVNDYKEQEGIDPNIEPLDGDETERLAEILLVKIDLMEGNITEDEYIQKLER